MTADAYSGMGRDELLRIIDELERRSKARFLEELNAPTSVVQHDCLRTLFSATLVELETLRETLTTAQAAGTEAQLGRQRARALLREVLDWGVVPESETIRERIRKELGILTQEEENDRALNNTTRLRS